MAEENVRTPYSGLHEIHLRDRLAELVKRIANPLPDDDVAALEEQRQTYLNELVDRQLRAHAANVSKSTGAW